jgi:parallel beta-helix repeat protein
MLRFRNSSNDASSKVAYTELRYGGRYSGDRFGAVHLEAASPTLTDNLFRDNYWYAISGDVQSFPVIGNNELLRNGGNGLEVRSGEMSSADRWSNTDIVYVLTGPIVVRNTATLNIDPGVTVKFAESAYVDVHGAFKAIGTAGQRIVFTSLRDDSNGGDTNGDGRSSTAAAGDWTMIRFYDDSNDASCTIDYASILYAGRYGRDRYGAAHVLSASPTIRNSTISNSFACAIWYDKSSSPRLEGNTYSGNADGDVCQPKQ